MVLSFGTWSLTPDFTNFVMAYRSSKRAIILARERGGRSQRDKLDRRRSTKLTIPLSSDARPLSTARLTIPSRGSINDSRYFYSYAQFTPPARPKKTVLSVSCQAVELSLDSRDRPRQSEQLADRSPSSRGV